MRLTNVIKLQSQRDKSGNLHTFKIGEQYKKNFVLVHEICGYDAIKDIQYNCMYTHDGANLSEISAIYQRIAKDYLLII